MRIGIDVRCFAGGKNTGVEEYTRRILEVLFSQDSEHTYVLFFNSWKGTPVDFAWATRHTHVRVRYFHIPNKILNFSLWYLKYPKLDQLLGGVDVFFMPNINFYALSGKTKLFVTIHDLSFHHYKETFSWKRRLWHWAVNPRYIVKRAYKVFAVSQSTQQDIVMTYRKDICDVIRTQNGFLSSSTIISRNDSRLLAIKKRYHLPYKFFLYFGTIEPRKNLVALISAYDFYRAQFPDDDIALVLAGSTGWHAQEIVQAVMYAKYRDDIYVICDISVEDKEGFYHLATVFVYPTLFEGFGFPPLEAFMAGLPVITSHTSSLPEVVGAHAIMIDPVRVEEIVTALTTVRQNNFFVTSAQSDVRKEHARHFSWQKTGVILRDTFSE